MSNYNVDIEATVWFLSHSVFLVLHEFVELLAVIVLTVLL